MFWILKSKLVWIFTSKTFWILKSKLLLYMLFEKEPTKSIYTFAWEVSSLILHWIDDLCVSLLGGWQEEVASWIMKMFYFPPSFNWSQEKCGWALYFRELFPGTAPRVSLTPEQFHVVPITLSLEGRVWVPQAGDSRWHRALFVPAAHGDISGTTQRWQTEPWLQRKGTQNIWSVKVGFEHFMSFPSIFPSFFHISGNIFLPKIHFSRLEIFKFYFYSALNDLWAQFFSFFFCFPLFLSVSSTALPPLWNHLKVTKKIKQTGNFPDLQKFWKATEWRRELKKKIHSVTKHSKSRKKRENQLNI